MKKEAQDAQEALKKAGIEPPTPAPKADTPNDEPKPLTMNNRKGEEVPVVVSCPCGQQHWSYPSGGCCIRCKAELPILEKPPKQIQERKPFLSHQAKNFFDKFEARNEPELELDDDQRQNNMTKAQSLLDTALQLGISSDEQLKMMKDTVEKFKNPKIKNTPKENSYALLAIGEKAGTEELKYWEATQKKMEIKISALQEKIAKAKEVLAQEQENAREYIEVCTKANAEHDSNMTKIEKYKVELESHSPLRQVKPPVSTQSLPPPTPICTREKLDQVIAADPEMQTNKDMLTRLWAKLCPPTTNISPAALVIPAPKGATPTQIIAQEGIEANTLKAELEANAQEKIQQLTAGLEADAQVKAQELAASHEQRRAQAEKEASENRTTVDIPPRETNTQVSTPKKFEDALATLKREVGSAKEQMKDDNDEEEDAENRRVRTRLES